jgi:hypothetical protein
MADGVFERFPHSRILGDTAREDEIRFDADTLQEVAHPPRGGEMHASRHISACLQIVGALALGAK